MDSNVGKSTLFNSLTKAGAESANYPFCTIDPNVGIVAVPDERLDKLAALYNSAKITPAVIEFVDIAGLVKGASKGEGLGNQFLANIREVDAIVHVVRCFEDSNIVHVDGSVNPVRDIETINLELIFSDMEVLERRLAKQKRASYNNKDIAKECDLIERLLKFLEAGNLAKNFECEDEDEESFMREYNRLQANLLYSALCCQKMTLPMMVLTMNMYRVYVNILKRITAKYSLYVHRLNRKSQNLMMMKRKCS